MRSFFTPCRQSTYLNICISNKLTVIRELFFIASDFGVSSAKINQLEVEEIHDVIALEQSEMNLNNDAIFIYSHPPHKKTLKI